MNTVRSNVVDQIGIPQQDSINTKVDELHKIHGLDPANPLVVSSTERTAGPDIEQDFTGDDPTTVTRRTN